MREKIAYFTVTNYGYLHKALALKKSLNYQGIEDFTIFMFDSKENIPSNPYENCYILIDESHHVDYLKLAFKYDVVEFTTSLKPTLTLKLLNEFDKVIFLDPDTYVYSTFDEVISLLDSNDMIFTPHFITPMDSETSEYPDLDCLKYGGFNLGFYAVNNSNNSKNFLKWWESRCINQCYFETQNGLSTDQKWIVIANTYFDRIKTLKNYGYNVAYWNANKRNLEISGSKIKVNGDNLTFMHFSSLIEKKDSSLLSSRSNVTYSQLNNQDVWKKVYGQYIDEINSIKKQLDLINYNYSYEKLNGKYITYTLRRYYGENLISFKNENPFVSKELESFALKHGLLSKNPMPERLNEKKVSGYKLKLLVKLYRILLRIIGFKNDINLTRLHIYLSSPHRIKNFFK